MSVTLGKELRSEQFSSRDHARFAAWLRAGETAACWPWQGSIRADGYGAFMPIGAGRTYLAHRVSYAIAHGACPVGVLRHTCDNPPCCNPAHLLSGTQQQNVQDMRDRNRHRDATRDTHPMAKFNSAQAEEALALVAAGWTRRAVGAHFGVQHGVINRLVGRTKHALAQ